MTGKASEIRAALTSVAHLTLRDLLTRPDVLAALKGARSPK